MNADAKLDAAVGRHAGVALLEALLQLDSAAHRVDNAAKFDDRAIARAFDHPAAVYGDCRLDQVASQRTQTRQDPIFVGARQPREPDDIGHENRRQLARFGHRFRRLLGVYRAAAATIQDLRVGEAGSPRAWARQCDGGGSRLI